MISDKWLNLKTVKENGETMWENEQLVHVHVFKDLRNMKTNAGSSKAICRDELRYHILKYSLHDLIPLNVKPQNFYKKEVHCTYIRNLGVTMTKKLSWHNVKIAVEKNVSDFQLW